MKVKELIKALSELPQDVEVYTLKPESLDEVCKVYVSYPGDEEAKEIIGDEFVIIE